LAQAQSGNRTDSDEIRILLLKKAYALTWKHPLTGVGMGKVGGAYDPVIEHARNEHVRTDSLELPTHNIYVEMFAATGVLGGLLFLGIVTAPLALAIRYCANYQLRLIAAGFCAVIFTMFFSAFFEAILFMSSAVMLAATVGTVSNPRFLDEFP
jgi:O-antigen ligase